VTAAFPSIEGTVVNVDGDLVEVAFLGDLRLRTANVEFYRQLPSAGGSSAARKIGLGRVLSAERGRAKVEVIAAEERIGLGDRAHSSLGLVGIGIRPVPRRDDRRELLELLAVRLAYELESRGRFRTELLDPEAGGKGPADASEAALRAYLWRGLQYTLSLTLVEEGAQATLVGRLYALRERRAVDLFSARAPLGGAWPALVAGLAGDSAGALPGVTHRFGVLNVRPVALGLIEHQERAAVLALTRGAVRLLVPQGNEIHVERTADLPPELIVPRGARDLLGNIATDRDGRRHLGHTLLDRSVSLDLESFRMEPTGTELLLGERGLPLYASYRRGSNLLGPLLLGGAPMSQGPPFLRFAAWVGPDSILVQTEDYRLALYSPSRGRRIEVSAAVGAGVSLLPAASPLVAATVPLVSDTLEASPDQITLHRLEEGRLVPMWRSEPSSGPILLTALAVIRGQLHVAAAEQRPDHFRLHLYSNVPIPVP
jgi:hypothetical protein